MLLTEKLDSFMKEKGISRAELSRLSGVPYTTIVGLYEKGTDNVKLSTLRKLADFFNCSLDYLVDDEYGSNSPQIENESIVMLPIVTKVSLHNGVLHYDKIDGSENTPKEWLTPGAEYFCFKAIDDSMVGSRINEGDLALIKVQSNVGNGEIAAVLFDGKIILRRIYKQGENWLFQSENTKYPPIISNNDSEASKIIGRLQMVTIKY